MGLYAVGRLQSRRRILFQCPAPVIDLFASHVLDFGGRDGGHSVEMGLVAVVIRT